MALVRVRIRVGNKVRVKNMGRALAEASDNVEILEGELELFALDELDDASAHEVDGRYQHTFIVSPLG